VRVLGVDACRAGWVGVVLGDGPVRAHVGATVAEVLARAEATGPVAVVAVDIPIGLPDAAVRRADRETATALGPRRSSVFVTPTRTALNAADYRAGLAANRGLGMGGFSVQAFALRPKVLEVDAWVRACGRRVVEVHPELSFARMAGAPLCESKHTWAGVHRRTDLLRAHGVAFPDDLGAAGRTAAVDDVLDAGAAAWSARRVAEGTARCLPDPPEVFSDGLPAAIWA